MESNRDEFILECNKKTAFEEVSANRDRLTEDEIVIKLIEAGFREMSAWRIAEELKRKS
jgi:hypothetical protein